MVRSIPAYVPSPRSQERVVHHHGPIVPPRRPPVRIGLGQGNAFHVSVTALTL